MTAVVAAEECRDLWLRGRGPVLLVAYAVLLSALTHLVATNQVLNFLEQREAVNLVLQVAVAVGGLMALLVSADAISGERERDTLESLLLAPVSRRAIVLGKLAAAMSLWFAAFAVAVPYLWVIGHGVSIVGTAVLAGLGVGTLLALGLSALGMLVSALAGSNKVSLGVCLFLLLALFAPTQLPTGLAGAWREALIRVNPVAAGLEYLSGAILGGAAHALDPTLLISPICLAGVAGAILIGAAPRLVSLHGGVMQG